MKKFLSPPSIFPPLRSPFHFPSPSLSFFTPSPFSSLFRYPFSSSPSPSTPSYLPSESPLCILFSGQGTYLRGMGHDLLLSFPSLHPFIDHCNESVQMKMNRAMFFNENGVMGKRTEVAQPCIALFHQMVIRALEEMGVRLKNITNLNDPIPMNNNIITLGHSLGELSALHFSSFWGDNDAEFFKLIKMRGEGMKESVENYDDLQRGGRMKCMELLENNIYGKNNNINRKDISYTGYCQPTTESYIPSLSSSPPSSPSSFPPSPSRPSTLLALYPIDHMTVSSFISLITTHPTLSLSSKGKYLSLSNINSVSQVVIGGDKEYIDLVMDIFKNKDKYFPILSSHPSPPPSLSSPTTISTLLSSLHSVRPLPLDVSCAFHTPLVKYATFPLLKLLYNQRDRGLISDGQMKFPVVMNGTQREYRGERVDLGIEMLGKQVTETVRFSQCIDYLIGEKGVKYFIEISPYKVLGKFVEMNAKAMGKKVQVIQVGNVEDVERLGKIVEEGKYNLFGEEIGRGEG